MENTTVEQEQIDRVTSMDIIEHLEKLYENLEITAADSAPDDSPPPEVVAPIPPPPPLVTLLLLSEPKPEGFKRERCVGKNNSGMKWGVATHLGRRRSMEDVTVIEPTFMKIRCDKFGGCTALRTKYAVKNSPVRLFAVYDGHGGSQVSTYVGRTLTGLLSEEWRKRGEPCDWTKKWEASFCKTFEKLDAVFEDKRMAPARAGTAAVVLLVSPCQYVVANLGDSRAVLCRGTRSVPLTFDHKPDREDETQRITYAGGRIFKLKCSKVEGMLSMSRAIGDYDLKRWIISVPEISVMGREEEDEFLIVASDGLWEVMDSEEAIEFARVKMMEKKQQASLNTHDVQVSPAELVADDLLQKAMEYGTSDNTSIIVIDLKHSNSERQPRCPFFNI